MTSFWVDLGALAAAVALGALILWLPDWIADRIDARAEQKARIRAYEGKYDSHREFTCPVCCRVMCQDCPDHGQHYQNCTYETLGGPDA